MILSISPQNCTESVSIMRMLLTWAILDPLLEPCQLHLPNRKSDLINFLVKNSHDISSIPRKLTTETSLLVFHSLYNLLKISLFIPYFPFFVCDWTISYALDKPCISIWLRFSGFFFPHQRFHLQISLLFSRTLLTILRIPLVHQKLSALQTDTTFPYSISSVIPQWDANPADSRLIAPPQITPLERTKRSSVLQTNNAFYLEDTLSLLHWPNEHLGPPVPNVILTDINIWWDCRLGQWLMFLSHQNHLGVIQNSVPHPSFLHHNFTERQGREVKKSPILYSEEASVVIGMK